MSKHGIKPKKIAKKATSTNNDTLSKLNLNAAGIDIGSEEHYVAVPEGRAEERVLKFGCYTRELHKMARWLKECGVETVAMESTGSYWIPVFELLEQYGFDVLLVDARSVKNVPGRKTDVVDCQWLQELHTYGLLRGSFRPPNDISILRSYWRHRGELVECCAKQIHLMQKALEEMNVQLHKAISDVSGVTGLKILRSIVSGVCDPVVLAKMRHPSIKRTEEEIVDALSGNYRQEHLFSLKQALELYDVYQDKLADCDREIQEYMATFETKGTLKTP